MGQPAVRIDLSDQSPDFRRLALQPGMALIDRNGAHAAILRKWLGALIAEPAWDGNSVLFQLRNPAGDVIPPKDFQPVSSADCQGRLRSELDNVARLLETAPARSGTERALRHLLLDRFNKLNADPERAANAGTFFKYRDPSGTWRLAWCWGYERKTSDAGTLAVCQAADCRTLSVMTETRRCPRCGAALRGPRSRVPLVAALLLLLLMIAGGAFWFLRPPELIAVQGQVRTAAGQVPVAGAIVRIAGLETKTTTDAEGRFQLPDLPPELATLEITAPGFHTQALESDFAQEDQRTITVSLQGAAELRGVVLNRLNDQPISGAVIALPQSGQTAVTNDQGAFHLTDLPGGPVEVAVSAAGFRSQTLNETLPGEPAGSLRFLLEGEGALNGTVIDALTLKPIPGAVVFVHGTALTAKTDARGRFQMTGIPGGSASIAVQAPGYAAEHLERQLAGTDATPVRVGLHGSGTLRGQVISQADGKPVAQAEVKLPGFNQSAQTNDQGEFEFRALPPGSAPVHVAAAGFRPTEQTAAIQENATPLDISLTGDAVLIGTVKDAGENKPLADVEVRIAGTTLTAKTGADGTFRLADVPGRPATVQVVGKGYRRVELPREFAAGQEESIEVSLRGGTILSGLVTDALTKTPIAQADVRLAGSTQKTATDANGRFRFEDVVAGSATVEISAKGYRPDKKAAELKSDEETALEIPLRGDAVLTGNVVQAESEKPLANVTVQIAGTSREATTDAAGVFRLDDVPSGLAELQITRTGFQPASIARDLAPGEETQVAIALTGAAVLTGFITTESGDPVPEAVVSIAGTSLQASSGSAGEFQVEGLTPGPANVTISAKGFHSESKTAELSLDPPTSLGKIPLRPVVEDPELLAKAFETPPPEGVIVLREVVPVEAGAPIPRADFRTRLDRAHAKTGDVQISLAWDNVNDLDLHVRAPSGEVLYYRNRHSRCGGELDVDMNAGAGRTNEPVENVYWPLNVAPRGKYRVLVHHYANHGAADPTEFRLAVKVDNEVKYYTGRVNPNQKAFVCEFERLTGPEPVLIAETNPETLVVINPVENERETPSTIIIQNPDSEETTDPKKTPPEYNRTREEEAAERLRLAESLAERKKNDAACRWCQDILQRYPETKACQKAKELLNRLSPGGAGDAAPNTDWVYLSDLTPARTHVGGGALQHRAIKIRGRQKLHSLWTRTSLPDPPATVEYALNQKYGQFEGEVGIDDSAQADRTRVSTTFQIVGDGKVLWTSGALRDPGKTQAFDLDVSGVTNLKIITESGGSPSHYAVWVESWLASRGRIAN